MDILSILKKQGEDAPALAQAISDIFEEALASYVTGNTDDSQVAAAARLVALVRKDLLTIAKTPAPRDREEVVFTRPQRAKQF